jgi:CPA1 family monovalent cation:H+ antiporter
MIATTDPSAVLAVFHQVGAPARLVRLVEGESLLNDAAAIAIVGVLLAVLTGQAEAATPLLAPRALAASFNGGLAVGAIAGRVVTWVLPRLGGEGKAEVSLVLALPYPLYLVVDQSLHWSGVVAVVGAGLVISGLGRTRLSVRNWRQLQLILDRPRRSRAPPCCCWRRCSRAARRWPTCMRSARFPKNCSTPSIGLSRKPGNGLYRTGARS